MRGTSPNRASEPMRTSSLILSVVAVAYACAPAGDTVAWESPGAVRAELDSLWSGLSRAMTAADTAALARMYSDSAYFSESGSPTMRGRDAILAGTAGVFACCRYLDSRVDVEVTDILGDRAVQFGTYRDVIQPAGEPPLALYGRVDALLERHARGHWQIRRLTVIRDSMVSLPPDEAK